MNWEYGILTGPYQIPYQGQDIFFHMMMFRKQEYKSKQFSYIQAFCQYEIIPQHFHNPEVANRWIHACKSKGKKFRTIGCRHSSLETILPAESPFPVVCLVTSTSITFYFADLVVCLVLWYLMPISEGYKMLAWISWVQIHKPCTNPTTDTLVCDL